jgi:hypothetical protein
MPLTVIQGPLPFDGEVIHPDVDLENWINQSEIFGLTLGAFIDTPLNTRVFSVATTEPPPTQDRLPGVLWFKRGEGRLYKWDKPDTPSGLTFADANWISISDRRDMFVRAAHAIGAGSLVQFHSSPSEVEMLMTMTEQGAFVKYGTRWIYPVAHPGSGVSNRLQGVFFVALDAGNSGALIRVCDWGFCDVLAGSGDTGSAGAFCQRDHASLAYFGFSIGPTQATSLNRAFIGITTSSSQTVTTDLFARPFFKFISPAWIPTGV